MPHSNPEIAFIFDIWLFPLEVYEIMRKRRPLTGLSSLPSMGQ